MEIKLLKVKNLDDREALININRIDLIIKAKEDDKGTAIYIGGSDNPIYVQSSVNEIEQVLNLGG